MKFKYKKYQQKQREQSRFEWNTHFAWWPVKIDNSFVFWEEIERRIIYNKKKKLWGWEYREKPKN